MSSQLNFLLNQAAHYIQGGNLSSANLLLKQIIKIKPNHSEALRLTAVILSQQGFHDEALEVIERAVLSDKRNGIAFSNKGNILLALDRTTEAIEIYKHGINVTPNYAEAYSNLGNALQVDMNYREAIQCYKQALKIEPRNYEFMANLGNAYLRSGLYEEAAAIYQAVVYENPGYFKVHFYLALAQLYLKNFQAGWHEYEFRWRSGEIDTKPLSTSKPVWNGQSFHGSLLVWAEQGLGDQILHASILHELKNFPQKVIITVNKKLLPIFKRSFPDYEIFDKDNFVPEDRYDYHIPIGSLGNFFRNNIDDFDDSPRSYLIPSENLISLHNPNQNMRNKKICGISWRSSNRIVGPSKSMNLLGLSEILKLENFDFLNLQYGDTSCDLMEARNIGINITNISGINLYEDLDYVLSLINSCDIVVTTSNSTAHMAGAIGKETILLLPYSIGAIWYWHDIQDISLWYPSIKIFKQEKQGDWSRPVDAAKAYLEHRFAI